MEAIHATESKNRDALAAADDMQLVDRVRVGDEEAVRILVKRYNQRLFRAARAIVRDDGEAEDIVQETYVRAFTALSSFRGEARLSTWLTKIALNEALGRVRRRRPSVGLDELDAENVRPGGQLIMFPSALIPADPEVELARRQVRGMLERAVDELPDAFRTVFVLREIEGMSGEETAEYLSIRPETVKTRLHRARKLLRATIEARLSGAFAELFPFDGARCATMADRVVRRLAERTAGSMKA